MHEETDIGGPDGRFPATRWSAVVRAGSADAAERRQALETLVSAYWKPIYKYLRMRWRRSNEDAKDLTQEFFTRLIEKDFLAAYDPEKARLRTFLRVCVDRLVQNRDRDARRLKRGGSADLLSLDFQSAEGELSRMAPPAGDSMKEYFEREWARALFGLAVEALEARCAARDRAVDFRIFERYDLTEDSESRPTYAQLAEELGLSVTTVTNRLAAARRELRRIVLAKLRELTGSEEEFRKEARSLLGWEAP